MTPASPSLAASAPAAGSTKRKHRPHPSGRTGVQHYQLNNVTTTGDPIGNEERVLILTPLARFYPEYWKNLLAISYPHQHIDLGFIVPKSREGNAALSKLEDAVRRVQTGKKADRFHGVTILRQDFETPTLQNEKDRHALSAQKARRAAMARARNSLVFTTIGTETSWVFWLDSDIVETPPSIIQDLAFHNRAVIVPNCFQRYKDNGKESIRPYDYNSWHDSEIALEMAKKMGKDEVIFEGYQEMATYRLLMAKQHEPGKSIHEETPLDGVGGTALLVKAEVHRDGAMFPPFAFYNLIETEGFAKMARRLGYELFGLPNYLVNHPLFQPHTPHQTNPTIRSTTTTNKRSLTHFFHGHIRDDITPSRI